MDLGFIKTNMFCRFLRLSFTFTLIIFLALSCSLLGNAPKFDESLYKKRVIKNLKKISLKQKIIKTLLTKNEIGLGNKKGISEENIKKSLELGYDLHQHQLKIFSYIKRDIKKLKNETNESSPNSLRRLLIFLNLKRVFNESEKILIYIKKRQEEIEENFPSLEKEISFYFDNVKKIKHNFKNEEFLEEVKLAKKKAIKLLKNNKNWLNQDQALLNLDKYFLSNTSSKKNKIKRKTKKNENYPIFIPLESLDGISSLREDSYILELGISFARKAFLNCQKIKNNFRKEFCHFDLLTPLFIKIQENSLSLLSYLEDKSKKNKIISKDEISSIFEVVNLNYNFEKLLKEIKNQNLNSIKKIKINDRLGLDGKKRIALNQAFLELLNFHYEMNQSLNIEYLKQKEKYHLKDSMFVRIKMKMLKVDEKIKKIRGILNPKTREKIKIILEAKGAKLKNKEQVKYINLLLNEISIFRKEKLSLKNKKDLLKVRSNFLASVRKSIGKLIVEKRGMASFYWTQELDFSKDFSKLKNRKHVRTVDFLRKLKPLYIILGKFETGSPYISLQKGYWDHLGVFLGHNQQLLDLGLNPKKGPYFWRKESITKGKNLLTVVNDKADIISINNYSKMFKDVMILKYEKGLTDRGQSRALWKDAIDLEGKKYKTEFDLLAQGKTIHEKILKDLFPNLPLKKKIFWRSPVFFPGDITSLVGDNRPLKPVFMSLRGKRIKGNENQLAKVSNCIQDFYCQKKLFQKIKAGEDYLVWLQTQD